MPWNKEKEKDRRNGNCKRNVTDECTSQCLCNTVNKNDLFSWIRNLIEASKRFADFSFELFGNTNGGNTTSTPSLELRPGVGVGQRYPLLSPARFCPSPASVPQRLSYPNGVQQGIIKTSGKCFISCLHCLNFEK